MYNNEKMQHHLKSIHKHSIELSRFKVKLISFSALACDLVLSLVAISKLSFNSNLTIKLVKIIGETIHTSGIK